MNLLKCKNGHFYDADKYSSCPHCSGEMQDKDSVTIAMPMGGDPVTVANPAGNARTGGSSSISLNDAISLAETNHPQVDDDNKTISYYSQSVGTEPVVGWLVCTGGKFFGKSFNLKSGRNFIGRASSMDVVLEGDSSVSRERHAVIIYEPKGRIFVAQPGESRELFYLNDRVVLNNEVVNPYDVLTLGNTKLMFIPCCGPSFAWEEVKQEENN